MNAGGLVKSLRYNQPCGRHPVMGSAVAVSDAYSTAFSAPIAAWWLTAAVALAQGAASKMWSTVLVHTSTGGVPAAALVSLLQNSGRPDAEESCATRIWAQRRARLQEERCYQWAHGGGSMSPLICSPPHPVLDATEKLACAASLGYAPLAASIADPGSPPGPLVSRTWTPQPTPPPATALPARRRYRR